ncbi:MAG: CYTH domain-containing protein [Actinomycetota bacterium]
MPTEIEYRYLVESTNWKSSATHATVVRIEQGYIFATPEGNMRVRIVDGTDAVVTVKGARDSATRPEYEWPIEVPEARSMITDLCTRTPIVKTRWHLVGVYRGWVVDVFEGENAGLIIAEREVDSEEESFIKPEWLGRDVTRDRAYSNANLQFAPISVHQAL